ncbi:MAG: RimK family alpha-L-glutamate ligase [Pseudobdellovibrionaceae bacterium]
MRIWILSSDSELASTKRLLTACKKSRHETEVLNPLELHFEFGRKGLTFYHLGKAKKLPDLALPRLGWGSLEYGLRLIQAFEVAGVPVLNSAESYLRAVDKLRSLQIFHQLGLPVPQTRFSALTLKSEWQLLKNSKKQVFKTLTGSQGFGVTWGLNPAQSQSQVDAFRNVSSPFFAQEMLEESFGKDIRVFVIAGEIIASMQRQGVRDDLRSNLHQGGRARRVRLSAEEKKLALSAVEALGLFYAGVDFLRTSKGPLLLEANPSPGFEGVSRACGVDVARQLVSQFETSASRSQMIT